VVNLLVLAPAGVLVFHALLEQLRPGRWALIAVNAALVAGAIVANLSFEEIGLDLFVVAAVAVLALALWLRRGPRPLILYFGSSYTAGLLLTAVLTMQ
jgi:FtsH-binding integral membrane protein